MRCKKGNEQKNILRLDTIRIELHELFDKSILFETRIISREKCFMSFTV